MYGGKYTDTNFKNIRFYLINYHLIKLSRVVATKQTVN